MSGENYRSATKSHEPGWNDPPASYSPTGTGAGQPMKLNLNKRVFFPVSHSGAAAAQPTLSSGCGSSLPQFIPAASGSPLPIGTPSSAKLSGSSLPPQAIATPTRSNFPDQALGQVEGLSPPPNVSQIPTNKNVVQGCPPVRQLVPNQDQGYPEDKEMMNFVKGTMEDAVLKLEITKQVEIRKRLDMIQQNWSDGKLGEELAKKLYRLAKAFTEARASEANKIHRSIIVDHGSVCVQWAPALRQLVLLIPEQKTKYRCLPVNPIHI